MIRFHLFILGAILSVALSDKIVPERVELVEKDFNEIISVDLKNANEDIKFVVSTLHQNFLHILYQIISYMM